MGSNFRKEQKALIEKLSIFKKKIENFDEYAETYELMEELASLLNYDYLSFSADSESEFAA